MADTVTPDMQPVVFVIFGITGDLAQRKVLPALYRLFKEKLVDQHTYIVGTSRREVPVADSMGRIKEAVTAADGNCDQAVLDRIADHLTMLQVNPVEDSDYDTLADHLQAIEDQADVCLHRLFYLSIPPQVYGGIVERLGKHGLNKGCSHGSTDSRLLVEKPFGYDLASAQELIAKTAQHFSEAQIFRIDHYLAKETAQNILSFRQHNPLFSDIWNHRHISQISITATEAIGIEGRANFYDQVGALRDLIQSHLLQLLSLTIMDLPKDMTADKVHAAKQRVLDQITAIPADLVQQRAVRGQYDSYRQEVDNPTSNTETYASIVLYSQDPNWKEVPLRLTTGKALKMKRTSITLDFGDEQANRLQFRLQPDEGITLALQVKKPGLSTDEQIEPTSMNFTYETAFKIANAPDAYERVLIEAVRGDHLLFATDQEVVSAWRILQPLISEWAKNDTGLVAYASGSDGPPIEKLLHS